ncbi:MAG: hypothetical protein AABW46_02470 [Nanoarchaeota archaeon]
MKNYLLHSFVTLAGLVSLVSGCASPQKETITQTQQPTTQPAQEYIQEDQKPQLYNSIFLQAELSPDLMEIVKKSYGLRKFKELIQSHASEIGMDIVLPPDLATEIRKMREVYMRRRLSKIFDYVQSNMEQPEEEPPKKDKPKTTITEQSKNLQARL